MRSLILITPLLLCAGSARELVASQAAIPEKQDASSQKLKGIVERLNKARNEAGDAYEKATTEEEKNKIIAAWPGKAYLPEFRALAEEAQGTDTAARAWIWVLRLTDNDAKQASEVVQQLLQEHLQSPVMAELSGELRYGADKVGEKSVIEALRAIVAESPHENVRAGALFNLGGVLLESSKPENRSEGRDCFEAVIAEYGSVPFLNSTYKAAAEGYMYELDHLQIGMAAPDFSTVDENGAPWNLADYKGKVVVVDFWGNW